MLQGRPLFKRVIRVHSFFVWDLVLFYACFLPNWGEKAMPRIEPLTVQSLRLNSHPCTVPLGYCNPLCVQIVFVTSAMLLSLLWEETHQGFAESALLVPSKAWIEHAIEMGPDLTPTHLWPKYFFNPMAKNWKIWVF